MQPIDALLGSPVPSRVGQLQSRPTLARGVVLAILAAASTVACAPHGRPERLRDRARSRFRVRTGVLLQWLWISLSATDIARAFIDGVLP